MLRKQDSVREIIEEQLSIISQKSKVKGHFYGLLGGILLVEGEHDHFGYPPGIARQFQQQLDSNPKSKLVIVGHDRSHIGAVILKIWVAQIETTTYLLLIVGVTDKQVMEMVESGELKGFSYEAW